MKIIKVSFTQKKSNEWILEGRYRNGQNEWMSEWTNEWMKTGGEERDLLNLIKRRKPIYFGRVMRKEGDCLEKETMRALYHERESKGDLRMQRIVNMEKWAEMLFDKL